MELIIKFSAIIAIIFLVIVLPIGMFIQNTTMIFSGLLAMLLFIGIISITIILDN